MPKKISTKTNNVPKKNFLPKFFFVKKKGRRKKCRQKKIAEKKNLSKKNLDEDTDGQAQFNVILRHEFKIKVTDHWGKVNADASEISLYNNLVFHRNEASQFKYKNPGTPPTAIRYRWAVFEDEERKYVLARLVGDEVYKFQASFK